MSIAKLSHNENVGFYNTHSIQYPNLQLIKSDITNAKNTINIIKEINPDVIIHCAGLVGVDNCASDLERAWKINFEGTCNIVDASKATRSKMVYISTSYVFDGKKGHYTEIDKPCPNTVYGTTKLKGEYKVQELDDYLIFRCSHLYSGLQGFFWYVLNNLSNGAQIRILKNNYFSPVHYLEAAKCILKMVETGERGIYNLAASRISRYEFAKMISDKTNYKKDLIQLVDSLDSSIIGQTDHSLDNTKIKNLGHHFCDLSENISSILKEIN